MLENLVRLLCFTLLLTLILTCQASQLPSVISLEIGADDNGGSNSYLDLDYNLISGHHLLASLASNRINNNDVSITTTTVLLGVQTNPLKTVSGGVEVERWGKAGTLITDTIRIRLNISRNMWLFSLSPQWRTLAITTDCTFVSYSCDQEIKVNSQGASIAFTLFTNSPWSFSLGYAEHDYDRKVEAIGRLQFG